MDNLYLSTPVILEFTDDISEDMISVLSAIAEYRHKKVNYGERYFTGKDRTHKQLPISHFILMLKRCIHY